MIDVDTIIRARRGPSKEVVAPYEYLERIPGNNGGIREKFLHAFNELYYHIDNRALLHEIGLIISIFHNALLLIDDIEDNSDYRRGLPSAHKVYGTPLTINCGNLMYFEALQRARNLPNLLGSDQLERRDAISTILVDEMLNLHHGQGWDIYWRDSFSQLQEYPSYTKYLEMVMDKTGGLFRLSVRLLALFSTGDANLPLANLLGIIYQIRDDYLNLTDATYSHMKGVAGEDLIEGKLSLPILHCLRTCEQSPVLDLLNMKDSDERRNSPDLVQQAIEFLDESGSLAFTKDLWREYCDKAAHLLRQTPGGDTSMIMQILTKLSPGKQTE